MSGSFSFPWVVAERPVTWSDPCVERACIQGCVCVRVLVCPGRGMTQPFLIVSLPPRGPWIRSWYFSRSWCRGCLAGGNLHPPPAGQSTCSLQWLSQCLKGRNLPHSVLLTLQLCPLYWGCLWDGKEKAHAQESPQKGDMSNEDSAHVTWVAGLPQSSHSTCSPLRPLTSEVPNHYLQPSPLLSISIKCQSVELFQPQLLYLFSVTMEMTLPLGWASYFMQYKSDM